MSLLFVLGGGVLRCQGEDEAAFAQKLEAFVKEHQKDLGVQRVSREGEELSIRVAELEAYLMPSLMGAETLDAGFNWLTLYAFFEVKDDYKAGERAQAVADWVNQANSSFSFCTFFVTDKGNLGAKAALPFKDELSVEDLGNFFTTFVASVIASMVSGAQLFLK